MAEHESLESRVARVEVKIDQIENTLASLGAARDANHAENSRRFEQINENLRRIEQMLDRQQGQQDAAKQIGEWIVRLVLAFGSGAIAYFGRDWLGHH